MMLEGKTAVVYGAAGHIGSTVSKALASDGARVFLTGRTGAKVQKIADEIAATGGSAEATELDALDEASVRKHFDDVVAKAGKVDITFNAVSIHGELQGTPLREMSLADFTTPTLTGITTHFLTATTAARQMVKQHSGVILTLSASASGLSGRDRQFHKPGGFGVACAAIEEFSRTLAGELGPQGIRVVCLRSDAIQETWPIENEPEWRQAAIYMSAGTALGRMPRLAEVADAAVFAASDRASAMTGTIINLTCGSVMDAN